MPTTALHDRSSLTKEKSAYCKHGNFREGIFHDLEDQTIRVGVNFAI